MADASTPIKKIQVGTLTYEIDASYFSGHTWGDIAGITFSVVWSNTQWASSTAPSVSELGQIPKNVRVYYNSGTTYATGTLNEGDSKIIYLIYSPNLSATGQIDNYDEYAYTATTGWERIGGTGGVDLSNYVTKNDYTSETALDSAINTSYASAYTANGTATISYLKPTGTDQTGAHNHTINAVSATSTVFTGTGETPISFAGAHSHQITGLNFNKSVALGNTNHTISKTGSHSHTVNLASTQQLLVTSVSNYVDASGSHSHNVTTHKHSANVSVTGFSASVNNIMCTPQVSSAGVLSWGTVSASYTVTAAGSSSAETVTTSTVSDHTHALTVTSGTYTLITSATISAAGNHTHTFNIGTTFNAVTELKPASDTPSYTDVSQDHTHDLSLTSSEINYLSSFTLSAAGDHTHTVTTAAQSTTGTAAVAIASHRHSVNAQHSHVVSLT